MVTIRTTLLLFVAGLMAGCATLSDLLPASDRQPREMVVPVTERPRLEPLSANHFVLETAGQSVVGEPQLVFAREEDTFSDLAREYGLGYDELVAANPGVDPWLPGEGTPVLLPTQFVLPDVPRRGVVLNVATKRLFYFPASTEEGEATQVMTFPIGIGRVGWETPLGDATVVGKARDPHWYVPASVRKEHAEMGDPLPSIVPPGPDNPLGRFVLQLDMPGYLIHGTNQPYGVGMRVSHGCVRLYPENIEFLYPLVELGEEVVIVNQPFLFGMREGELFFEAHQPLEDDAVMATQRLDTALGYIKSDRSADDLIKIRAQAEAVVADGAGVPMRLQRNDLDEIYERARIVRNTVEPDPDVPTLAEVRAILDAPLEEVDERGVDAGSGVAETPNE